MTYPLTYLYLLSFVVVLAMTVAVGMAAPSQPAKRSLVLAMITVCLWALASFLMNLAATPGQMRVITDLFAIAWCALPFLTLRAALLYGRNEASLALGYRLLLAVPMAVSLWLKLTGRLSTELVPAWRNGGAFDVVPTDWQLLVNVYFFVYFGAAGIVLWRKGVLMNAERVRRTAGFFLMLALPGVLIGSWSSDGLSLVSWRPFFLDSIIASAVVAALGGGMLREIYFKPWASAEEARRRAEEQLATFMSLSPDCLAVVDFDGHFRLMNLPAAQILGFDSVEACLESGRVIDDFVPPAERKTLGQMRLAIREGEVLRGVPLTLQRASGEQIETEISVSLLRDADGAPSGFVAALRDVSERRSLEEGMRQTQKLESLGLLASGIAHDFNNLLSVVIGSSDLALAASRDQPAIADNVQQTLRGAKQLAALTRELLVYSGRARQVVGPLSLSELVQNISGLMDVSLPRGVTLHTDLGTDLPTFSGDATQIQQVVLNLITNAAEASAEASGADPGRGEGRVRLSTSLRTLRRGEARDAGAALVVPAGEYLCLEVEDDGPGIDPEIREKIFDPFFTSKVAGRGLGLSAVLGIVREHGGYTLLSSGPRGTTFRVLLPPGEKAARPAPARPGAHADIIE
ncbi:MAG: ATP-binding protein [Deltaproteobacteria bacterium]|nr:ATP-binding protein [Deltaproteobacteria bacterium]